MKPVLTIAIPTFNRARLLSESLAALAPQCESRPVEICVSNNASTDNTSAVLAAYPRVRSIAQTSNIGIDRNIVAAIRMACSEYVLPIGDDEILLPGAIDRILEILRQSPHMLILNADRGCIVRESRKAFELYWDKMPLGGFVIRTEFAAPQRTDRYFGTFHAYSGAAWDYLAERPDIIVRAVPERLVEFDRTPKSYASIADRIHFRAIPEWFDLLPAHYDRERNHARRVHRRRCTTPRALAHFARVWLMRNIAAQRDTASPCPDRSGAHV